MSENIMKKIVVYVISYNQEDTIARALDSVLFQKEWGLHKIIISDDCSKDRTWDIVCDYQSRYPDIVEPHRNKQNLGIYGNIAVVESLLPDSDLYCPLAGDDTYCDGYFESVQKLIKEKQIDVSEPVGIYSDWKSVKTDGTETIYKQNTILLGYPLFSLKIRGFICGRSLMITSKVREAYGPMVLDRGLNLAESNYDAQPHLHIKKAYYFPQVTTTYYRGGGISSRLSVGKSDYATTQAIEAWKYMIEHYITEKRDLYYANYEIQKATFFLHPTWKGYFKMMENYIKGQLPGCKNPLGKTARLFVGLAKYKRCFKSQK